MGWIASFFSNIKAEIESLITVVVGSGGEAAVSDDAQQADSANTSHHDSNSARETYSAIPSLMDQQADSGTTDRSGTQRATADSVLSPSSDAQVADVATGHSDNLVLNADFPIDTTGHQQIEQDSDTQNAGSDPQPAGATHNPLLLNADFLIDTTDHSAPAPRESDISGLSAIVGAPADQDLHATLPGKDIHAGISAPLPDAGEFALASSASQFYSFAQGAGGGSGGGSGGPGGGSSSVSITSNNGGTTPFVITLFLDSSLQSLSSTNPTEYAAITSDLQTVANFFATHFTNNPNDLTHPQHSFLMNVGWGEAGGSAIPSGALGESSYNLYPVSYSSLQAGFQNVAVANETASGSQVVNIPGSDPFSSSNPEYMITAAQKHALNIPVSGGTGYGSVGFSSAANTFFFDPSHPVVGQYDFMGIVAHEMSEVLGRVTLNGAKAGNLKELASLDLFHFADSNGAPIYSGTTAGHFALSQYSSPGVLSTPIQEFNNVSSNGDFGDWAANADAFASAPAKSVDLPFSYADYLAMEAAGYSGNFPYDTSTSQTAIDWNSGIATSI